MSELAVSTREKQREAESDGAVMDTEADFVSAFNRMRAELVSTLYYVLGNQDDAQDVAQEVFIKCWRTRDTLTDVKNLRAWIFRVGLNAAKDLQRNAWRRRAKPMGDSPPPELPGTALAPGADGAWRLFFVLRVCDGGSLAPVAYAPGSG